MNTVCSSLSLRVCVYVCAFNTSVTRHAFSHRKQLKWKACIIHSLLSQLSRFNNFTHWPVRANGPVPFEKASPLPRYLNSWQPQQVLNHPKEKQTQEAAITLVGFLNSLKSWPHTSGFVRKVTDPSNSVVAPRPHRPPVVSINSSVSLAHAVRPNERRRL